LQGHGEDKVSTQRVLVATHATLCAFIWNVQMCKCEYASNLDYVETWITNKGILALPRGKVVGSQYRRCYRG